MGTRRTWTRRPNPALQDCVICASTMCKFSLQGPWASEAIKELRVHHAGKDHGAGPRSFKAKVRSVKLSRARVDELHSKPLTSQYRSRCGDVEPGADCTFEDSLCRVAADGPTGQDSPSQDKKAVSFWEPRTAKLETIAGAYRLPACRVIRWVALVCLVVEQPGESCGRVVSDNGQTRLPGTHVHEIIKCPRMRTIKCPPLLAWHCDRVLPCIHGQFAEALKDALASAPYHWQRQIRE
jgi:hypothetical protein